MIRKLLLFLVFILQVASQLNAQIVFEKGYVIDDLNQKNDCLIKNVDWKNNPESFEYKVSENSEIKVANASSVKQFEIYGASKYVSALVQIDKSSNQINELDTKRNPDFEKKQLFLKVLIEGKASLYSYKDNSISRFFYSIDNGEIKQLVYKKYLVKGNVAKNNYFRQQLLLDLKYEGLSSKDVEGVDYTKKELECYFTHYNEGMGVMPITYGKNKKEKRSLNYSIKAGVGNSQLKFASSPYTSGKLDLGSSIVPRISVEVEYILPFNKNKWSVFIKPTYQRFVSKGKFETTIVSGKALLTEADYQSIEIPIGLRQYFFLNQKDKLFANLSYILDYHFNSSIDFKRLNGDIFNHLDIQSRRNFAFGFGYSHHSRINFELEYQLPRNITGRYTGWKSRYSSITASVGYTF